MKLPMGIYRALARLINPERFARWTGVKMGCGCRIYTREFGAEPWLISIGDRVTISAGVKFITHDGASWLVRDQKGRRYRFARIKIGSDVFVGLDTILMPGVSIGDRVIVGAGSVVTKSVPEGAVVAGNPARIIGTYESFHSRALSEWPSEADLVKLPEYRMRVESAVEKVFRAELSFPETAKREVP